MRDRRAVVLVEQPVIAAAPEPEPEALPDARRKAGTQICRETKGSRLTLAQPAAKRGTQAGRQGRFVNAPAGRSRRQPRSLLDHLIELRRRLLYCVAALVVSFFVAFYFAEHIFGFPASIRWRRRGRAR